MKNSKYTPFKNFSPVGFYRAFVLGYFDFQKKMKLKYEFHFFETWINLIFEFHLSSWICVVSDRNVAQIRGLQETTKTRHNAERKRKKSNKSLNHAKILNGES